jgi:NADH-quinone oxidoreductase subunit A
MLPRLQPAAPGTFGYGLRRLEWRGYSAAMQEQYLGILVLVGVAAIVCGAMVTLSWLLGPKRITPYKQSSYECGVEPIGNVRERFPIKFYLLAILFILFDIEVVLLWSWMTVYRSASHEFIAFSFFEFMTYMGTWVLGYVFAIRVGAFDWDESTTLDRERSETPAVASELPPAPQPVAIGSGR